MGYPGRDVAHAALLPAFHGELFHWKNSGRSGIEVRQGTFVVFSERQALSFSVFILSLNSAVTCSFLSTRKSPVVFLYNRNVSWISLAASIQFSSSCFCFWVAVECFHLLLISVVWLDAFPLWSKLWMSFLFPADFPVVVIFFSPTSPCTSVCHIIRPLGQRPAFPAGVPAIWAPAWMWFSLLPFTGCSLHVRSVYPLEVFEFLQDERCYRSMKSS